MKTIYVIFDKTAQEIINCFIANNDKHAIKLILSEMQRQPLDVEFDLYSVCQVDVFDSKKLLNAFLVNKDDNKPIFNYPQSLSMDEEELKEEIKKGE